MDMFSERVPPQNMEAEQSVLGACLIDSAVLAPVRALLQPLDFYAEKHQWVFEAICKVNDRRDPVDLITVQDELAKRGRLDDLGGLNALTSLVNMVPTTANTEAYARIVADKSLLRSVQRAAREIVDECYRAQDAESMRAQAVQRMHAAAQGRVASRERQLGPALMAYAEDVINTLAAGETPKNLLKVPFRIQDHIMPMAFEEVTVAIAQSGVGKTTYEKAMQFGCAKLGQVVKGYSLEMSETQLKQKYWGLVAEINTMSIRRGKLTAEEIQRTMERIAEVYDIPLYFQASPRMKWTDIKVDATAFAARHGKLDLITVDYLQILGDPVPKTGRRDSQLGEIVEDAKQLAEDLNCHILFLAQQKINKAKPVGDNEDVAESRDIVRASDNALFLTRPLEFNSDATIKMPCKARSTDPGQRYQWVTREIECGAAHPRQPGTALFHNVMLGFQGKQRMGSKAVIPYEFIPETGVIRDLMPPMPWDDIIEDRRNRDRE